MPPIKNKVFRCAAKDVPEIVCMVGSTKFWRTWQDECLRLTLEGKIVLTIGSMTASDETDGITPEQKVKLDELHKRKIDLCDWIYVLDVNGYVGQSTASEIKYAYDLGKRITYLETGCARLGSREHDQAMRRNEYYGAELPDRWYDNEDVGGRAMIVDGLHD